VLQRYGWEKGWELLAAIAANARALPEHSSQVPQDTISGQLAYSMLIDTYAYSAVEQAGADKLEFIIPAEDTIITPDPIGILKGAKNVEVAKAFIEFSLSPEGQKIWMYKKGEPEGPVEFSLNKMSNLPSLYKDGLKHSNVMVNPFTFKQAFEYSFEKGSTRWALVDDMTGALLVENHDALVTAWKKAGAKGIASFFKVPVSEEEGLKLAKDAWNDPVQRGKIVAQWKQDAAKAYAAVK